MQMLLKIKTKQLFLANINVITIHPSYSSEQFGTIASDQVITVSLFSIYTVLYSRL